MLFECVLNYGDNCMGQNSDPLPWSHAHREIFSKYFKIKPNSDCIHHFPIDSGTNGRPFGSKSIGKC